jgi:hypothetical protein
MPLVILVVYLLLHSTVEDNDGAESFLNLRVVECFATVADLIEELVPLLNIVA